MLTVHLHECISLPEVQPYAIWGYVGTSVERRAYCVKRAKCKWSGRRVTVSGRFPNIVLLSTNAFWPEAPKMPSTHRHTHTRVKSLYFGVDRRVVQCPQRIHGYDGSPVTYTRSPRRTAHGEILRQTSPHTSISLTSSSIFVNFCQPNWSLNRSRYHLSSGCEQQYHIHV